MYDNSIHTLSKCYDFRHSCWAVLHEQAGKLSSGTNQGSEIVAIHNQLLGISPYPNSAGVTAPARFAPLEPNSASDSQGSPEFVPSTILTPVDEVRQI